MVIKADEGDDAPRDYTGGNHLKGGVRTARLLDWQLNRGGGDCSSFSVSWTVELMAYNTVGKRRPIAQQQFVARFYPGVIETVYGITLSEPASVLWENGPQMTTDGFRESLHFIGGAPQPGTPFIDDVRNSGPRRQFKTDRIAVVTGTNAVQASWVDPKFDAGDGRYVDPRSAFMRSAQRTGKVYQAIVTTPIHFNAGQGYQWRGGYAWGIHESDVIALIRKRM
ncbi:hypothetical protein [Reyranella soli]|uniref:hypothetical protein n=1 Tax=Reyranella soli TaxID=1230389 RepID=UPI0014789444|nr:hypothetical protein [Reyranella soli]